MKKYKIGYTSGVYDLFHIGHLNIIMQAKKRCEYLIVAVSTDELVQKYKNRTPVIPFKERAQIVAALKYVDRVVPQESRDKIEAFHKYHFDVMFVGDDWKGSEIFEQADLYFRRHGAKVVYLKHTDGISTTMLREQMKK